MHLHFVLEIPKLLRCRQLSPDQQIGGLQETAVDREIIKGVAPIRETPLKAINVANRRLGGGDTLQTGSEHQPCAFMPDFAAAGLTHHHPQLQLINAT
jgi:hypothetical protein